MGFAFEELDMRARLISNVCRFCCAQLSLLVHPDKHADNPQAHEAFEVVNKAYKSLTDPEQATKLKIIVSEAKLMAAEELKRRRKPPTAASAQQQHQILSSGVAILPGEADEVILDKMARAHATLLFVDLDRKRKEHDAREALNKKRARELELEMEESRKKLLLSKQAMDDSRDDRVASWRTFVETGKKSGKTSTGAAKSVSKGFGRGMRPPKLQPEARTEFSLRQQQASDQLHGGPTE
ncbi:hypothetical protein, variant [Capsaspora owczarzaki ATCC 30864]|uniref:J domain-containing protein n=1 Tax=Capsaspora owczarzaki (strain ATCC 30864) TaxID=595528 RepID=A0A0D2WM83_CAPO3|nr:hypothetical protein, variant [Capsaspora owczarzaki ATCC 30864]